MYRQHRSPPAAPLLTIIQTPPNINIECCSNVDFVAKNILFATANLLKNIAALENSCIISKERYLVHPTGAFVPRAIPGRSLNTLMIGIAAIAAIPDIVTSVEHTTILHSMLTPCATLSTQIPSHTCSQTAAKARIAELEAEIARLRSKRPAVTSPISPRLQPLRTAAPMILTPKLAPAPRTL